MFDWLLSTSLTSKRLAENDVKIGYKIKYDLMPPFCNENGSPLNPEDSE